MNLDFNKVFPTDPSIFEGFGIPIIESLYSKTPVITSRGSCFAEAGGPSSIYIDPKNEIELANAILKIEEKTYNKKDIHFLFNLRKRRKKP